jgi:putative exporter of polyketide antibiotics
MSISKKEQKLKAAKLVGALYFLGLGLINFCATFFYSQIHLLDVIILSFGFLPLVIKHRSFSLIFGLFAGFISLYLGFACFTFNLNPQIHTSQTAYNMGYLLSVTAFLSSLLLIYVGLNSTSKREMEPA